MSEDRFKKWRQSEKGKLSSKNRDSRYLTTEKGKDTKRKWIEDNREKVNDYGRNNKIVNTKGMLLTAAKRRAKLGNYEFSISKDDINIPEFCPILDIPLYYNSPNKYNSPSLDKIIPSNGYTPGNVQVISWRANMLKNDATLEELEKIVNFLKQIN